MWLINNYNKFFKSYLIVLFIFAVFFLFQKYEVGNDSTISEWLINYEGGFTKRGIIGQISIYFTYVLNITLRESILLFQILIMAVYYLMLFFFLKNLETNRLILLAIFSPIFILYPVAEIEVLARKEVFIFIAFLFFITSKNENLKFISRIIIFPISVLVWEPVILFLPFWFLIDLIDKKIENFNKELFKLIVNYLPAIFISFYIAFNPMGDANHDIMSNFLKTKFDESCYMSCALLKTKSSLVSQFTANFPHYSFEVFFRYILIITIGFGPLFILSFFSKFKTFKFFLFKKIKNIFFILFICLLPGFILFAMGYDWGRWVNINYTYAVLFYIYLLKENHIEIDQLGLKKLTDKFFKNKKIFILFFIIFCFGWNPKTVMKGDVASFPGYRIPYKTFKIIKNKYIINLSSINLLFIKKLS